MGLVARWAAQGIPTACDGHFAGHGRAFQGTHGNKTIYAADGKTFPACGAGSLCRLSLGGRQEARQLSSLDVASHLSSLASYKRKTICPSVGLSFLPVSF